VTWFPPKRGPRPSDYHDVSPEIYDFVSDDYTAPHDDGRDPRIVAASIARQFRKAKAAKKSRSTNAPPAATGRAIPS
jgi:hypothetical protein